MLELPKLGDEDVHYDGSRVFTWLADLCGLSVDLVNFLLSQIFALFLASLFRSLLHPSKVSLGVRHAFGLTIGLFLGYFCFGQQAIHIAGLPALCYIVIRTQNPQIVQRLVMVVSLIYLSCVHLHRLYYDYGSYSLDITGPLMIITQKVTSLAFSIHDGLSRDESELTKSQQYYAVRKLPSALEFFSYVFHFQGLMAGPMVFYKDYIEFIEGAQFLKHSPVANGDYDKNLSGKRIIVEPSPIEPVVKKVIGSLICVVIFMKFITIYPIKTMKDNEFVENTSFLYKFFYMMMATTVVRFKYYHAWLLADAICNNSGLGFNGYDDNGKSKWDLISNINVISFEFATNMRNAINNWNIGTNRWLRGIIYERVPKRHGTLLTFCLSALWHGFYPGYYVTFASGAVLVMAARVARKMFRHRFQTTMFSRLFYDFLTMATTRIFMGYVTFPFVLLEFLPSLRMYLKVYMCLHLVALLTNYILPKFVGIEKRSISNTSNNTTSFNNTTTTLHHNYDNANNILYKNDVCDKITTNTTTTTTFTTNNITTNNSSNNFINNFMDNNKDNKNTRYRSNGNAENFAKNFAYKTKNIEDFFDKTVTGIVDFKDDLMKINSLNHLYPQSSSSSSTIIHDGIIGNGGNIDNNYPNQSTTVDQFIKKEIDALHQATMIPAVLSNGHAK